MFKVACENDPVVRLYKRGNEATAIGSAIHTLNEKARDVENFRIEDINTIWTELIEDEYERLADQWKPAQVPPYEQWPNYYEKKIAAIRSVKDQFSQNPMRFATANLQTSKEISLGGNLEHGTDIEAELGSHDDLLGMEIVLNDPDKKIYGRADRIELTSDGFYRIVDLKTGHWTGLATQSQKNQLLIYAFLLQQKAGSWPKEIGIEDVHGEFHEIKYETSESERLIEELLSLRDEFNNSISSGNPQFQPQPSMENCTWCSFKIVCSEYWEKLSEDWNHQSLFGEVISDVSDEGKVLEIVSPNQRRGDRVSLPPSLSAELEEDQWLAVTDYKSSAGNILKSKWRMLVRHGF